MAVGKTQLYQPTQMTEFMEKDCLAQILVLLSHRRIFEVGIIEVSGNQVAHCGCSLDFLTELFFGLQVHVVRETHQAGDTTEELVSAELSPVTVEGIKRIQPLGMPISYNQLTLSTIAGNLITSWVL